METLLTILVWLWQIAWVLLLAELLARLCLALVKSRRRLAVRLTCLAAVAAVLTALCLHPLVVGEDLTDEERTAIRHRSAGLYSWRVPGVPVACAVQREQEALRVEVYYLFLGSLEYQDGPDGIAITRPLLPN